MLNLRSTLRRKLFEYYFTNTAASHYLRELAYMFGVDAGNLARELSRLEREGIFISMRSGKQKYFKLNTKYPLFNEYKKIIFKTIGIAGVLKDALQKVSGIELALLYGSFAKGEEDSASDIDLLLVGDSDTHGVTSVIEKLEKKFSREINITTYSSKEFRKKRKAKDPFLQSVFSAKYEVLRGKS